MKVLIDTCVIVDSLQNRKPFSEFSNQILLSAANEQFIGYITAKSVADIYYLMHKCTHSDEISRKILNNIFKIFEVLDTSGIDCKLALLSSVKDYEDAIMCETALRNKIDCIVTRNFKDFTNANINIYKPDEFLKFLSSSEEAKL